MSDNLCRYIHRAIECLDEKIHKSQFSRSAIECCNAFYDIMKYDLQINLPYVEDSLKILAKSLEGKKFEGRFYSHHSEMISGMLEQRIEEGNGPAVRSEVLFNLGLHIAEELHLCGYELHGRIYERLLQTGLDTLEYQVNNKSKFAEPNLCALKDAAGIFCISEKLSFKLDRLDFLIKMNKMFGKFESLGNAFWSTAPFMVTAVPSGLFGAYLLYNFAMHSENIHGVVGAIMVLYGSFLGALTAREFLNSYADSYEKRKSYFL